MAAPPSEEGGNHESVTLFLVMSTACSGPRGKVGFSVCTGRRLGRCVFTILFSANEHRRCLDLCVFETDATDFIELKGM